MFDVFRNAFKLPDLRKRILYTLMILVIFRIGSAIPVPFLDPSALSDMIASTGGFFSYLNVLTGGAFEQATIFAMSITPYINSSIIIQLLTVAIPALERMQKEGEEGRKKLNKITRYTTVLLGLIQAIGYYFLLRNQGAVEVTGGFNGFFTAAIIVLIFTAGTALIMWLGEQINEKGIGNGISMILFAGIVARGPGAIQSLLANFMLGISGAGVKLAIFAPITVIMFLAMIVFIIIMNAGERRIPVQYAKRQVGRKMYGGQSTHIPIKVAMSGVMPIIFASSILSLPSTIAGFVNPAPESFWYKFAEWFRYDGGIYALVYFFLIIGFNYFYVSIQYNPVEIANNLRKNNGGIPGIRPGKPTSDLISKIITKITLIGAIFLAVVAIVPIGYSALSGINVSIGGTSIIIVVGVALETMRSLESQMMMRHHKGFLE